MDSDFGLIDKLKRGYHSFIAVLGDTNIPVKVYDYKTHRYVWANKRITTAYNETITYMANRERELKERGNAIGFVDVFTPRAKLKRR